MSRRDELAERLAEVRGRIAAAAESAGRDPADITLVVVTKTWPESDIRLLHELGVVDVGENRHPEAEDKAVALHDLGLRWHFIGQIQSNKAARIAGYADVVHSIDSTRLAHRLNAGAHSRGRVIDCLVQVNLDPEAARDGRGGVVADDLPAVLAAVDDAEALRLRGLMGVAPLGGDPVAAYARLAAIAADTRASHPAATWLSAGMSGDFEQAIQAGATHVRVGSLVLGQRPPLG